MEEGSYNPEFRKLNDAEKWDETVHLSPAHKGFNEALKMFFEKRPLEEGLKGDDLWSDRSIELLSDEEIAAVLKETKIEGDRLGFHRLTPDILIKEGLQPRFKFVSPEDSQTEFFVSVPYIYKSRSAHFGCVRLVDGKMMANTYYKSNSHRVWRYLPDYKVTWGKVGPYGKGYNESGSIDLPYFVQKTLDTIDENVYPLAFPESALVFAGTARRSDRLFSKKSRYYREVNPRPVVLDGNFYPARSGQKVPPEQLVFNNDEQRPDFSKPIASWGNKYVRCDVYSSFDGKTKYTFARNQRDNYGRVLPDDRPRAWVAGVETESPLTSMGLRKEWVDAGDLATPLKEYKFYDEKGRLVDQSGNYGVDGFHRRDSYVDMYPSYVSKIPVVQEYLAIST